MTDDGRLKFQRRAFAKDDGRGNSTAEWTLTPSSLTDPVQIIAEPIDSLPIIFVPGIMGSNLMATVNVDGRSKGEPVWLMNGEGGAFMDWFGTTPAQRQTRLNPQTTAVYDRGALPPDVPSIGNAKAIREQRFWGEVSAMSYGDFLSWLQRTMNQRRRTTEWRVEMGQPDYASNLVRGMTFKELTEADVSHAADFRFPVYACGYNWLQSNMEGAKTLSARVDEVIKANNSKSYSCTKVILVTHSMGGLVARACSELHGMRDKIAGNVHGVMPASGAAAAYKRVRSGTEGAAGIVIGDTAEKVTAVFANSPGALQLLPNKEYGNGWLRLGMTWLGNTRKITRLPKNDPYEEIYKQRGTWWALVRDGPINPVKSKLHKGWTDYNVNTDLAADFHKDLAGHYHPITYSFHGDGKDPEKGLTWGRVGWLARGSAVEFEPDETQLLTLRPLADNGKGLLSASGHGFRNQLYLTDKDTPGDGTVPVQSGQAPASAGSQATYGLDLSAVGHEGAFRSDLARRLSLHAILRIARTVSLPR